MDLTKFINKFACDEAYYGDHDFITNSQMGHLKKSPLAYQKYKNMECLIPMPLYLVGHFTGQY